MNDKPYSKVGDTYYPKKKNINASDEEVIGSHWRVWKQEDKYFYEYDCGHFATKFKTVEISEVDFNAIKSGDITDHDLTIKYRFS